jgi:N-methylhydantoinase A
MRPLHSAVRSGGDDITRFRIGVDVGGTFTDFLVVSDEGSRLEHKTSSTPEDSAQGVVVGLEAIAARLDLEWSAFLNSVEAIVHGTTVATNAILTRRGANVGVLCTDGFRDTLTFRDGTREETYNNRLAPPEPLAPRHLRVGIKGRMDFDGNELEELSEQDVREAAALFEREGVDAVAICFMHSPMNQSHEHAASELLEHLLPGVYQTVSADLITQLRYYDRMSTAVLNSYVGPVISRYLESLAEVLSQGGFAGVLLVMQSNGGLAAPSEVCREAARAVLSGPASGPAFGLSVVQALGFQDCLTIDMGGTSFDASLVKDGNPLVVTDGVFDRWRVALPMIGIHTIGAGGGSIARVRDGLLQVGPMSAGAIPGPACYGNGGELPTVTDADLVLGYLNEDTFLEGRMRLDADAAREAIYRHVAAPLGVEIEQAAAGIYNLVNVNMAAGVREITVRRGHDPRDFPLVVAGGAGPVHATAIARELSMPMLVVPREASIFCAAGLLSANYKHDFVHAIKRRLKRIEPTELQAIWQQLAERATEVLRREGVGSDAVALSPSLDLRYAGQWWELNASCPEDMIFSADVGEIANQFHALHERLFGYKTLDMPIDVLAARLSAVGMIPRPPVAPMPAGDETRAPRLSSQRAMWSLEREGYIDVPVFDGALLPVGVVIDGPLIVELGTSTVVVHEGFVLRVDGGGSFVVSAGGVGSGSGLGGDLEEVSR